MLRAAKGFAAMTLGAPSFCYLMFVACSLTPILAMSLMGVRWVPSTLVCVTCHGWM